MDGYIVELRVQYFIFFFFLLEKSERKRYQPKKFMINSYLLQTIMYKAGLSETQVKALKVVLEEEVFDFNSTEEAIADHLGTFIFMGLEDEEEVRKKLKGGGVHCGTIAALLKRIHKEREKIASSTTAASSSSSSSSTSKGLYSCLFYLIFANLIFFFIFFYFYFIFIFYYFFFLR